MMEREGKDIGRTAAAPGDAAEAGGSPCSAPSGAEAPESENSEVSEVAALKAEVESLKAKVAENWDLFLRSRADFDNYRRRVERDVAAMVRRGKRDLILRMLEVVDNFSRALAARDADAATLRAGLEMLLRQMEGILSSEGVRPIEAVGRKFDPAVHEAVATWDSEEVEEETVTDEIQRGYTYEGEVLRAARVRVALPAGKHGGRAEGEGDATGGDGAGSGTSRHHG